MSDEIREDSLRARLVYEPQELRFGTSGRRGEVVHLTQLEIYCNVLAELEYLQSLPAARGGIVRGDEFYLAYDLRPSSTRFLPEQMGRGEIAQAMEQAIRDAGMRIVNLGPIPTPALTCYALARGKGSMMITGSHIPFDWNGYKTNSANGELSKTDEGPINEKALEVRQRLYSQRYAGSPFNEQGRFKDGSRPLSSETGEARSFYIERYARFFEGKPLEGIRVLVYQHSSVGRDLLVEILQRLGAVAIAAGRSDAFIPIDTENVDEALVAAIQALADDAAAACGPLDAVVSMDGDGDRPMVLAPAPDTGRLKFFGGDLLGMIVAEYLQADAVVVPVSCNDAIDRGNLRKRVAPKTRIGSPYVAAGMEKARRAGARLVCGWEANGGFILGSDIVREGGTLSALPTRDAVLPILGVLLAAREKGLSPAELFARLPKRYSRAALLKRFPRARGRQIVNQYSPVSSGLCDATFGKEELILRDADGKELPPSEGKEMGAIRERLESFFSPDLGFGRIVHLNYTDGLRMTFSNGDVAHVRPSGNADDLRIYAVSDTQERADRIAQMGVSEPDGILRKMEKALACD